MSRRIVDARADSKGNISHVRLDGNQRFTPVATAIPMARRGEIANAHVVDRRGAITHLSRALQPVDEVVGRRSEIAAAVRTGQAGEVQQHAAGARKA